MLKNNQSFEITIGEDSINQVERFVDRICDQLFINDTYFGNILMSLTEMINLARSGQSKSSLKIFYNTDYQKLKLTFEPIDSEVIKLFDQKIELENILDSDNHRSIFLIHKLTDDLQKEDDRSISLFFDIGALHNSIYEDRKSKLQAFLKAGKTQKVKDKNDSV